MYYAQCRIALDIIYYVCINEDFHPESVVDFRVLSIDGIMLPLKRKRS